MNTVQVLRRLAWSDWGGIETVVTASSRALEERGVRATILATQAMCRTPLEERGGLEIRRFGYSYTRIPAWPAAVRALDLKGGNPTSWGLLRYLLQAPALDLVSCHTMGRLGGHVRWACETRGIPYVVTLHGGHFDVPPDERERLHAPTRGSVDGGKPLDWLLGSHRYLADASAILALSASEAEAARSRLPGTPVHRLRNGVDVAWFAAASRQDGAQWRQSHGIPSDSPLIVCVARLDPQKGQDLLLEAVARSAVSRDAHVAFIGPESVAGYGAALAARAEGLGLGRRTHVLGAARPDSDELRFAYAAADVVALASRHEPFGVVLLEAWAARRPVVAFAVGGIPSFVEHESTGLLAPAGDLDALAAGISRVLSDHALGLGLAERGHAEAMQRYDWRQIAADIERFYAEAQAYHRSRVVRARAASQ